jgi:hypothetical protein
MPTCSGGATVIPEEASYDEKRNALDWTTDELVAWLSEHATDGDGAPEESDREPDSVH